MTNDLDTLLRESLQAEADDVVATPELYTRIHEATAVRPPSTVRRTAPWLLVAAAAAAVAVGVVAMQDDDQTVITPPATEPTTPTTETPPTTPTAAERPDHVVAVLDDGRLVMLDVDSGASTELYALADPRESEGAAEPDPTQHAITDAVLSPDGQTVYFGTSGGEGGVYRMPVDGSAEPERLTFGWGVSVSNDGGRLVFAYNQAWGVLDLETGASTSYPLPGDEASPQVRLSPDGTQVEVLSFDATQHQRVHTLNERGKVTATQDGFATWAPGTVGSDASSRWLLEIVEPDDASTFVSWGTSSEGLTTDIPNPDHLVVRTVDW